MPPTSEALLAQQLTAFRAALAAEESAQSVMQSPNVDAIDASASGPTSASREFEGLKLWSIAIKYPN